MSKYIRHERSQRKHPVASSAASLIKPPLVPVAPKERPGWKGPGFVKKTQKQSAVKAENLKSGNVAPVIQQQYLPLQLQQSILNILRTAFPVCQDYEAIKPILQEIRLAIYNGDSEQAFSRPDQSEAYAVRWSSVRALCCATVILEILQGFPEETWAKNFLDHAHDSETSPRATCLGGGATELLTFATVVRHVRHLTGLHIQTDGQHVTDEVSQIQASYSRGLDLYLVDRADWAPAISSLEKGLLAPPVLSKYASQSAIQNNASFSASDDLRVSFQQSDVLDVGQQDLAATIGQAPTLVTLFFTLGDLCTTSTAKAAALLLTLTLEAPRESLLLVVDSAESTRDLVAANQAGKKVKRYGISNFLDFVLMQKLDSEAADGEVAWEELIRDKNRLFKLADGLQFPLSLDHVNFQLHLFKKR